MKIRQLLGRMGAAMLALALILVLALPALAQNDGMGRDGAGEGDNIISEMGILLLNVEEGSPADLAGLQSGDIVLAVNGIRVESLRPMWRVLSNAEPGDLMTLVVKSGSEVKVMPLTVGQRPGGRAYFGVTPLPVFGQKSTVDQIVGLDESGFGGNACSETMTPALFVIEIVPGGPADGAGLRRGDVIVAVDGVPVPGEEGIRDLIQSFTPGRVLALEVYSQGLAPGAGSHHTQLEIADRQGAPGTAYLGMQVAELQYVITDCGASGSSVAVEAAPPAPQADPRPELPVDPSAIVPPPAGLEHCTYEQTWAFGVTQVLPDGPAEAAGLAANDAILLINGKPIPANVQAESLLADYAPGQEVILHVVKPFDIAAGADAPGESDIALTLGEHPNVPGRAYLGIMGMPVIMGDTMSCSGTAPAEPVPAEPVPDEVEASDGGLAAAEKAIPQPATKGDDSAATITSADVTTPTETVEIYPAPSARADLAPGSAPTEDGFWMWCPKVGDTYTCLPPAGLDAPVIIAEPSGQHAMPVAPPPLSGGIIITGTTEFPTLITPSGGDTWCWTGQGFTLCQTGRPVAPGPSTDDDNQ